MKKDQYLPTKHIHSNNSSGKPFPDNYKVSRQLSTYRYNYLGRSPDLRNSRNFSKNRLVDQTVKTIDIKKIIHTIQTTDPETPHTTETETIRIIETDSIKVTDHETFQTIGQTTIDQITITITRDHVTICKIETRIIKIGKKIFSITA